MQLSLSHCGYRPNSPKTLTLCSEKSDPDLPEKIPYYLRQNCLRLQREREEPEGFSKQFPYPYDLLRGRLIPDESDIFYRGTLQRTESRWGTFWQADFSDYDEPGSYQIETDILISPPFPINDRVYDRFIRGYLTFLGAQRCGCEVPGVHPAWHLDDGILDTNGQPWPATGGWHDAGDFRKWMSLTQPNLEALAAIAANANPLFRSTALEEIAWGNRFFTA